jgi:hypothetical protein
VNETATAPDGVVHVLTPDLSATVCGQDARGWSRAITIAQLAGLVLHCEACHE